MSEPIISKGSATEPKADRVVQLHDKDGNNIYPVAVGASSVWVPDYANLDETNLASNNTANIAKTGFAYITIATYSVGSDVSATVKVNGATIWHNTNEANNPNNNARSIYAGFTIPVSKGDVITSNRGLQKVQFIPGKWVKVSGAPNIIGLGGGVAELPDNLPPISGPETYSTDDVIIGTWVDGSPIYRRVFQLNVTTVDKEVQMSISDINPRQVIDIRGGLLVQTSGGEFYPVNYQNPLAPTQLFWCKSNIANKQLNYYAHQTGVATIIYEYLKGE